jgi:hypothetical protein
MTADTNHHAPAPQESLRQTDSEQSADWHLARQRALHYLDHFDIPAFEGLELALTALQRARQITETAAPSRERHPVETTINELRNLMTEKGVLREAPPPHGPGFKYSALIREVRGAASPKQIICSMPALERRSMKPATFKRKH